MASEIEIDQARECYCSAIQQVDQYVEQLHKCFPDDVFIFTSDRGELLGEYNIWCEHWVPAPYPELRNVPLIMIGSDLQKLRIPTEVTHLDIAPTICELLSVPVPQTFEGRSLFKIAGDFRTDYIQKLKRLGYV